MSTSEISPIVRPVPKGWPREWKVDAEIYECRKFWPKISIITPSFEQGAFLEDTILSIIHQQYPNLEFILVDGGSQDESVSIIRKYDNHLTWWTSEKDKGQSDALNKGLAQATGEIVNWICSDDLLMPQALYHIALSFESPENQVICGWSRQFAGEQDFGLACTTLYSSWPDLLYVSHICQPSTWFRMSTFQSLIPLNTRLHFTMDSEIWLQYLLKNGRTGIQEIATVLTAYRYHDNSKTISQDFKFRADKQGLYYPLLCVLNGPAWLRTHYQNISKSEFHQKAGMNSPAKEIPQREVVEKFILETISDAKIHRKYGLAIRCLISLIVLNPVRPWAIWKIWLKTRIAPKLFR